MNFIYSQKSLLLLFFLGTFGVLKAQKSSFNTVPSASYYKAIELYNNKSYAAAQQLFTTIAQTTQKHKSNKASAFYYEAMCAIKLNQEDATDKVVAFVRNYPYHPKKEKAYLNVGNHYFANRKATHALKWYQKVNEKALTTAEKNELYYKKGYALLVSNYLTDAKANFKKLLGNPVYGNDARYYYGYVAYKQENFGEAEDNLSQLANNATYQAKANYYILDISFKAGRFDKSVQIGEQILAKAKDAKEISQISKIIGESYFNLKQYAKAIPYLKAYKGKNGKWNNTDYYYLGYAYYKQEDFEEAEDNFNKIIGGSNMVAQNAYYHLGECYLKLNKKVAALNAFKNASEMEFDAVIKEGAALNYAKLSYEQGNPYQSVPEVLKSFLASYPKSPQVSTIKNLLITSYLHQQDYVGALEYLSKNKTEENNELYKEVALYRGIQLFNTQKITEAKTLFTTAGTSNTEAIKNKALYWLAETEYSLGNYKNALQNFMAVSTTNAKIFKSLHYNIGYTYFKLQNYSDAATHFQLFLDTKNEDNDLNDDAGNRLGDSFYASKKYEKAVAAYQNIINQGGVGADYAQYQIAMSNGFITKNSAKISALNTLINTYTESQLQDDALFELAATYTNTNKPKLAQKTYNTLLEKHSTSSYVPSVLLRQGLLYYNQNNNTKALTKFKEIVAKHPNSNEAKQAVTTVKNVYIDIGKVDEYAAWVKTVKFINVTDAELDNASYQAAENKFLENNTDLAIKGFVKYITNFPKGNHILKANFYLAQSYTNIGEVTKAIPLYRFVIAQEKSEFTEESLTKLINVYLKKDNWKQAMPLLATLEKQANYPQNIIFAQSNLMKGNYTAKNYKKAIAYAEKVLSNSKIATNIAEDAKVIIARASFKTNDYETARDFFAELNKKATGKLKAETLYYNAFFLHDEKEYELSNEAIQSLIANYSSYKYWGVKSYIIMAKNYYALKDAYQATYILDNIVKNFTQYKDLVEEASNELSKIKNKEAKTNESVNGSN